MRDLRRPAAHPLVELVHDLHDAVEEAGLDGSGATPRARLYEALHSTLRSARRLVDALDLLVVELEAQQGDRDQEPPADQEADDADFERIQVR